jgi:hypothetical protein
MTILIMGRTESYLFSYRTVLLYLLMVLNIKKFTAPVLSFMEHVAFDLLDVSTSPSIIKRFAGLFHVSL